MTLGRAAGLGSTELLPSAERRVAAIGRPETERRSRAAAEGSTHDYIPSRANLHRRHIDQLSTCDTCRACEETTFHALTECTYARQFWIRLRELSGVKLPNLIPNSWTMELLEDGI